MTYEGKLFRVTKAAMLQFYHQYPVGTVVRMIEFDVRKGYNGLYTHDYENVDECVSTYDGHVYAPGELQQWVREDMIEMLPEDQQ